MSTKPVQSPTPSRGLLLTVLFAWAAFFFIWILPLARPRGLYLGGHYQLRDVYLGIPVAFATLCATAVILSPAVRRRALALRLVTLSIALVGTVFLCDALYTVGLMGVLRPNYWFDTVQIVRKDNLPDATLGFVRRPHLSWHGKHSWYARAVHYRTDENGFRNPPGVRQADVVFIGDSFTEATGVPEENTFVRQVEQRTGLRSVNLGRSAYGPQQELRVLKKHALAYNPRVIVWQLFEGNDLRDIALFRAWQQGTGQSVPLLRRYFDNSLLNQLLTETIPPVHIPVRGAARVRLRHLDGTEQATLVYGSYKPDDPRDYAREFTELESALDEGFRICRERDVRLLVVFVPTMVRVMGPHLAFENEEDRERFLPGGRVITRKDFGSKIGASCRKSGYPFIDAFPALCKAARDSRSIYIPGDEHLDLDGHRTVADLVEEWILSGPGAERGRAEKTASGGRAGVCWHGDGLWDSPRRHETLRARGEK